MQSVRRRMMAGETLPECDVCNSKLLNTDVYRTYFWHLFKHKYNDIWSSTDASGATTMKPVSWDYRFSNLCNFKCRTCGDMLSSAWESEQRQHNMIDWTNPKNNWMQPAVKQEITAFQDSQIEAEFAQAVAEHRVEEVYWVGGEPLMYEQHWRYMKQIVDQGDGGLVYARYNTNLSRVQYRGVDLYNDILDHMRDWQICASLDGTGATGEYIRTGLSWPVFL
jgi:sulfatase maturation enzyme AslB (radical SAM superfamily)